MQMLKKIATKHIKKNFYNESFTSNYLVTKTIIPCIHKRLLSEETLEVNHYLHPTRSKYCKISTHVIGLYNKSFELS